MAAKKKPSPAKSAKSQPKKPIGNDAVTSLSLNESERLRLRTFLAEHRRYNAEATMRLLEKQALIRQLDPDNKLGLLDQAIRAASENATKAQQQHNETLEEIEKRLKISIKDFSFDEDTGRLWPHTAATKE